MSILDSKGREVSDHGPESKTESNEPSQEEAELMLKVDDAVKRFKKYTDAWIEAPDDKQEQQERQEESEELQRQLEVMSYLAADLVNTDLDTVRKNEEVMKTFKSCYDTFFALADQYGFLDEMGEIGLKDLRLEKQIEQKQAQEEREQQQILENEHILPYQNEDQSPLSFDNETILDSTQQLVSVDLFDQVGPDSRHRSTVRGLGEFISDIASKDSLERSDTEDLLDNTREQESELEGKIDLIWLREELKQYVKTKTGEFKHQEQIQIDPDSQVAQETLWDSFVDLIHEDLQSASPEVMMTLLGKNHPDTEDYYKVDKIQKKAEQIKRGMANLFNLAIRESVIEVREGGREFKEAYEQQQEEQDQPQGEQRQSHKQVLEELYGDLPEELDYETEALLTSINVEAVLQQADFEEKFENKIREIAEVHETIRKVNSFWQSNRAGMLRNLDMDRYTELLDELMDKADEHPELKQFIQEELADDFLSLVNILDDMYSPPATPDDRLETYYAAAFEGPPFLSFAILVLFASCFSEQIPKKAVEGWSKISRLTDLWDRDEVVRDKRKYLLKFMRNNFSKIRIKLNLSKEKQKELADKIDLSNERSGN